MLKFTVLAVSAVALMSGAAQAEAPLSEQLRSLANQVESKVTTLKAQLVQTKRDHIASVAKLTADVSKLTGDVAATDTKRVEAVASLNDKHTRELSALKGSSVAVISALRTQQAKEVASLESRFAVALSTSEDNRIESIATLEIKRLDAVTKLQASISKLSDAHIKEVALLEIKRVEGIDNLREVFKEKKNKEVSEVRAALDSTYRREISSLKRSAAAAKDAQATAEDKFPRYMAAANAHTNYRVELNKGTTMVAVCADSIGVNPFNKLAKFEDVTDCAKVLAHLPKLNEVMATYGSTNVAEFKDSLDLAMIERLHATYVNAVTEARGSQVGQNAVGDLLGSILGGNK